jgi:hypothetical protein
MNPKKLWTGIGVCLVALSTLAATIVFYNDPSIPQKTVFDGSEVLSVQQTGPNAYRWSLLSDIRDYTAGSGGDPVTVIYVTTLNVTTNYTTNAFITQLTVVSNAFFNNTQFVNYSIVTNLTVLQTNIVNNQFVTNQTIINTNYVNNNFTTNQTIVNTQYVNTSITTNLNVKNLTVESNAFTTNIYFVTARSEDIAWPGPTNTLNFALASLQRYATLTPFSVTNVVGATNGFGNTTLLCVTNTAGSNVWFIPPSGWKMGTNDMTNCTAGGIFEAWFMEATGRKTIATKLFP